MTGVSSGAYTLIASGTGAGGSALRSLPLCATTPGFTPGKTRNLNKTSKKRGTWLPGLFLVLYVQDPFRLPVVGFYDDRIGDPVEYPEFCLRHRKPPDQAVKEKDRDERFSQALDCGSSPVDLCAVPVHDTDIHHHLPD